MQRALIALLLTTACADDPASGPGVSSHVEYYDMAGRDEPLIDVLFVVDDTTPMSPYQSALTAIPASIAAALDDAAGAQPDLRVFVTTTSGDGALHQPASTPVDQPYLALSWDARFERTTNFTGSFTDALAALLAVGDTRQGAVAPLESARAAFTAHADVFRDASMTDVVTISASDDASASPVGDYVTFLMGLNASPDLVAVAGFYPMPATRLDAFHASFPDRATSEDIATTDFGDGLGLTQWILTDLRGDPCVTAPADVDGATPGLQADCDLRAYYSDGTTEAIRICGADLTQRCIELVDDPAYCMASELLRVRLHGFPGRYSPPIRGQCVVPGV